MHGDYTEVKCTIKPLDPGREILIAYLSELPFESIMETEIGLMAYMPEKEWKQSYLEALEEITIPESQLTFTINRINAQNWNAAWEAGFEPIRIDHRCAVRAPFHEKSKAEYDIVIMPKMSFGTGHHETTFLMLEMLLDMQVSGKSLLDMGCGTGVLAILACKMKATEVYAIDIDSWSYDNTLENIHRNSCDSIRALQGDVTLLPALDNFDIILANINKNVLLSDIPTYASKLKPGGVLVLSGYYKADLDEIETACRQAGLTRQKFKEKNNWVASKYVF